MTTKQAGFTLIELLIVVAIIAILAMIAVPNFLEAQTRAKVSRVKADLRSLAVAEEAYRVDWNSYTNRNNAAENPYAIYGGRNEWAGFRQLTTPVAYITSIPMDPFGQTRYTYEPTGLRPPCLELGAGAAGIGPAGPPWDPGPGFPSDCYMIESDGPDHYDDTRDNISTSRFPWADINANDPGIVDAVLGLCYDPTNGTVSKGEILRFGGQKPSGRAFDVLWSYGSAG